MSTLLFPGIGDHTDVGIDLSALDLNRAKYTIQPGDKLGALATLIYPSLTADDVPPLPPAGTIIDIPLYACMMLRQALAGSQGKSNLVTGVGRAMDVIAEEPAWRFRWLGDVGGFNRSDIARLVLAYVGWHQGEAKFEEVTQGRQGPGYSACGDLWNFVLERLGAWDPLILNRNVLAAGIVWKDQKNLSTPFGGAVKMKAWVPYKPGLMPNVGDLVLIGTYPEQVQHALVFLGNEGFQWTSGDYGQVDLKSGLPSSKIVVRTFNPLTKQLGARDLLGWIDISKVPRTQPLNMTGVDAPSVSPKKKNVFVELATGAAIAAGILLVW